MSETPGTTRPAGEGVDDAEMVREVARQTPNDLAVEGAFQREAAGTSNPTEAAAADGDDLR